MNKLEKFLTAIIMIAACFLLSGMAVLAWILVLAIIKGG